LLSNRFKFGPSVFLKPWSLDFHGGLTHFLVYPPSGPCPLFHGAGHKVFIVWLVSPVAHSDLFARAMPCREINLFRRCGQSPDHPLWIFLKGSDGWTFFCDFFLGSAPAQLMFSPYFVDPGRYVLSLTLGFRARCVTFSFSPVLFPVQLPYVR